jgi:hypothetical protein
MSQYGVTNQGQATQARSNGLGTAGFVTGLLGLILCWFPFLGVILSALGVILGGIGMSNGKKYGSPTGLAVAGLVLGIIGGVLSIIILSAVVGS